jgi:hypothetical protein
MRGWKPNVVRSGEGMSFAPEPADDTTDRLHDFGVLTGRYLTMQVKGSYRDAFGKKHSIEDSVKLVELWTQLRDGRALIPVDLPRSRPEPP